MSSTGYTSETAARDLAKLMGRELGATIDPFALRLFLKAYWLRVSQLGDAMGNVFDKEGNIVR